jgi:hypothetical protein
MSAVMEDEVFFPVPKPTQLGAEHYDIKNQGETEEKQKEEANPKDANTDDEDSQQPTLKKQKTTRNVKEFDLLNDFDITHFMAVIFGCSGSGKSFLMKHFLHQMKQIKYWKKYYLISPTELLSHSFNCFDEDCIEEAFDEQWLKDLIQEKTDFILNQETQTYSAKKRKKLEPVLIIIDDCAADPRIRNSPALNKLFISGRHLNMGVALLMQNINARDSVPLPVRNNATLIVTGKPRKKKDREFLTREWFSSGNEKEGEQLLLDITNERYQFAVVNLQKYATSTSLYDFVYKIKAPAKQKNFKLEKKKAEPSKSKLTAKTGNIIATKTYEYLLFGNGFPSVF